jgi:hypothetical protein
MWQHIIKDKNREQKPPADELNSDNRKNVKYKTRPTNFCRPTLGIQPVE